MSTQIHAVPHAVPVLATDSVYRLAYIIVALCVAIVTTYINDKVPPDFYFSVPIVGTLILFAATIRLGHSPLGADLLGICGYELVLEIGFAVGRVFFHAAYVDASDYFLPISYGLYSVLVGRLFWYVKCPVGRWLSYPTFDFIRPFVRGRSDMHLLSTRQRAAGYMLMGGSFAVGVLLQLWGIWFVLPCAFAALAGVLIGLVRDEEVDLHDMYDKNTQLAKRVEELERQLNKRDNKN